MKTINLKEYFNLDYKYDWESSEFRKLSADLLKETNQYTFFEKSPSKNKNFEKQLSDLAKVDIEN